MSSSKAFRFVTVSTLIHTGAVLALIVSPGLLPKPEPEPMGTGATIEFAATNEVPLGEQTEVAAPVAEAAPTPAPTAEVKPAEAEVTLPPKKAPAKAKKATPKVATVLPPKEKVSEPQEPEVPAVAVVPAPEALDSEIAEEPSVETAATETANMADDEAVKELATTEEAQVEEQKPEVSEMAAEELAEDVKEEQTPVPAAVTTGNDESTEAKNPIVVGDTTGASGAAPQNFGTSQGLKNYEDLKQVPGNKPPQYPEKARLQRQEGQVVLQYFVTASGQVSNMKIIKSSGYASLDEEALNSVSKFKYRPGQQSWTVHPVNFSLKGPEEKMGGRLRTTMR